MKAKWKAEVEKQAPCHCPELFSDLLQFITDKESNESLASSIAKLPYVQSKVVAVGATEELAKNVDDVDHLSQLKGFIKHINTAGNLRGRLVLMKFLLSILELNPEVKATYERMLIGDGSEGSLSVGSSRFLDSTLQELRKPNLIGRKDISKILDIINEKDRLQIFDCYPRLILKSGNPSKLRALEVRGAVTGFIGGVFVRPNTGHSYFEVTLKGCSLETLGVRIGWGLSGVEVTNNGDSQRERNAKNEVHDLPGDYGDSWTFDGSSGGHYFHNAKAIKELRMNEVKLQAEDLEQRMKEQAQKPSLQASLGQNQNPTSIVLQTEIEAKDLEPSVPTPQIVKNSLNVISDTRTISDTIADVIQNADKEGSTASTTTSTTTSAVSQLLVGVPPPAADYCAISAALASMDKQIADIDFSALLNVVRLNAGVTVPVQAGLTGSEEVSDGASDPLNNGTPDFDFVDYTKSLTTTDTFDLLVDSQSNSPSGRANSSSLFQSNTGNVPVEGSLELEGIEGPVLDYAKVFIKMLKVGIDINTISTTSTRSAIHALLTHENISDEAINNFIFEQKARDLCGENEATNASITNSIPTALETDAGSRNITTVKVEDDVLKSKASEERSRECALASGGIALTGSSEENMDDCAQYQPFPPFPSMPDTDSSIALSSASSSKAVWCAGTVIGSLLNTHTGVISFFVNGKRIGSEVNVSMGTYSTHAFPVFSCTSTSGLDFNIGQVPFAFEPAISISVAKNQPMVCLASLFDTYPTATTTSTPTSTSTPCSNSSKQSGKNYSKGGIEESVALNITSADIKKLELNESTHGDKEKEKDIEVEVGKEEECSTCSPVLSALRSPFFRLGSFQSSLTSASKFEVDSYDEGPANADIGETLHIDDDRILSDMVDSVDHSIPSIQNIKNDRIERTNVILINDDLPNFVYQGVSVETSVRLLPDAFYDNSAESVNSNLSSTKTSTSGIRGSEEVVNKSFERVIFSFILKADGRTPECSLTVQKDYSIQFSIKDFSPMVATNGEKRNEKEDKFKLKNDVKNEIGDEIKDVAKDLKCFTYSTVGNTVLPLVWVNISIVISNASHSNSRDQNNAKCNISIFVNKTCAASFFCPYLNSLLESSSCEAGKIALGGYLSSIEKKKQHKIPKTSTSDIFINLLDDNNEYVKNGDRDDEVERDDKDEMKCLSKDNDSNREEKDEKDAKEEKEGEREVEVRVGGEKESIDLTVTSPYTAPVYRIKPNSKVTNWIGDICEFRFWVVPRSADTTFNSLGRSRVLGIEADLVVCLAFQEGVGYDLHDSTILQCVRSRDSIIVLHDTEEHSSASTSSSASTPTSTSLGKNVLTSDSLWGFQVSHKTFAARRNLRSIEEHSLKFSKSTSKFQSITDKNKIENLGSEIPSSSKKNALSSFVFIVLEAIGDMFLRISENYLDADSEDPKVSQSFTYLSEN